MNAECLLKQYERISETPDAEGRLRQFVLHLAVRGKLVRHDPRDTPTSDVLAKFRPLPKPPRYEKRSPELIVGDCGLSVNKPAMELPEGWSWVPLVNIARLESGHTPSRTRPDWWGGDVPWIGLVDARIHNNGEIYETIQTTNAEGLANSAARLLPKGTVCFSRTASVGYVVIMGREMATSQDFVNWVPTEVVWSRWLQLVLIAERPALGRFSKGAIHQTIYYPAWLSMHIALPPLKEQHRIVSKVDELMALCDQLEKARAERETKRDKLTAATLARLNTPNPETFRNDARFALDNLQALTTRPDQIKQLRRTILSLGVNGRLVPQYPGDESAAQLLDTIDHRRKERVASKTLAKSRPLAPPSLETGHLPHGWTLSRLGTVYDVRDGTHDTPKYVERGYPLITSKNLSSGTLSFEEVKFIAEVDHKKISQRSAVDADDILFAMIGSIGNPVIVDTDRPFSIKNVALFKYVDRQSSCPKYLRHFLTYASNEMKSQATGGLQPFVSLGFLRSFPIPVPPLAEQQRIAAAIEQLMTVCDALESALAVGDTMRGRLLDALLAESLTIPAEPEEQCRTEFGNSPPAPLRTRVM